jgi:hypothetical protein
LEEVLMNPWPFVNALMDRATQRDIDVVLEDDYGPTSKKLRLTLPERSAARGGHKREVVHIVATGELGMIDFDNSYNFVRPIDSDDVDDVSQTASEFIELAISYLEGRGDVVNVTGWLCGSHKAFVVRLGSVEYEIGEGNHVSRFRPI